VIWGIVPYDPLTMGVVGIGVTVLAATASFVPAMRIARLEPSTILREE